MALALRSSCQYNLLSARSAEASIVFLVLAALALMVASNSKQGSEKIARPEGPGQFLWVAKTTNLLWFILVATGLSLLTGHLALGLFLSHQLVATSVLIVIIYLLHCLVDEILTTGLSPGWVVGDLLRKTLKISDTSVNRISLLGGTFFDFILVFIGLPSIVSLWALTWLDVNSWISKLSFRLSKWAALIYPCLLSLLRSPNLWEL